MKSKLTAVALIILSTTGANAFSTNYNWTGFYAGVIAGYSFGIFNSEIIGGISAPSTTNISGALAGVSAGANYQVNQFVTGIEGDIVWSGVTGNDSCTATQICTNNLNWIGTVRGRAGIAIDNSLLFATVGIAIGNGTSVTSPATVGSTGTDTKTFVGWTVGVGAEYAVNENIRLKAEYSYTDLGTRASSIGTVSPTNAFAGRPTFQSVKVGINFAFDAN